MHGPLDSTTRRIGVFALVAALLTLVPAPVNADHIPTFAAPTEGTRLVYTSTWNEDVVATFGAPTTALVGHLEQRSVAPLHLEATTPYYSQETTLLFDLQTGSYVAQSWEEQETQPGPLWWMSIDGFEVHDAYTSSYSGYIGLHYALPESLLWNRDLRADTWAVPTMDGTDRWEETTTVTIGGGWSEPIFVDVLTVRQFDDHAQLRAWHLEPGDSNGPIAAVRELSTGWRDADGTEHWFGEGHQPVTVTPGELDELPFEGQSHLTIVAERDQTLSYATYEGIFPYDPDPHPAFDVRRAGEAVLDLDDSAIHAFFAKAETPRLVRAYASEVELDASTSWGLTFEEAGGNALEVSFVGLVPLAGPVVILDHEVDGTSAFYNMDAWEAFETTEFGAIGEQVRLMEDAVDDPTMRVRSHSWYLRGYNGELDGSIGIGAWSGVGNVAAESLHLYLDPASGIVRNHATSTHHMAVGAEPLPF